MVVVGAYISDRWVVVDKNDNRYAYGPFDGRLQANQFIADVEKKQPSYKGDLYVVQMMKPD